MILASIMQVISTYELTSLNSSNVRWEVTEWHMGCKNDFLKEL